MAVVIENLQKTYVGPDGSAVPVVDVPSFQLLDGQQVALIGSSGSGKTTLLHLIAGILTPDSGRVRFGSVDICALPEAQRDVFRGQHVGYVFQTHHLLAGFSALENVLLGMSFTGRSPDHAWARRLLDEVGLTDRLHYKPSRLSLGQQQRVAVARALANRPKVVLADEPTGALDPSNADAVLSLIQRLCKDVGAALLMVTHDHDLAARLERTVELSTINRAAAPRVAAPPAGAIG